MVTLIRSASLWAMVFMMVALGACDRPSQDGDSDQPAEIPPPNTAVTPRFVGDSALALVRTQVGFGPRIPGSASHRRCGDWMVATLRERGLQVVEQRESLTMHDGKVFELRNIVGIFRPQSPRRMVLAAHWDTRPFADMDVDNPKARMDGANDGASGVAVLLELARHLDSLPSDWGIDLVFFDLEDYGVPEVADSYAIGSQVWSRRPHVAGYRAQRGVLLDMVGAADARFCWEGHSLQFAPDWTRAIWQRAGALGYGDLFVPVPCQPVTDDHYYVNTLAGIPMVDIIDLRNEGTGFPPHWHTRNDQLNVISPRTMTAVGQTLLDILYRP